MLGRTDSRARMVLILLAFVVVAAAASVRLGQWQVVESPRLTAEFVAAIEATQVAPDVRADIVDRDGVILARTSSFDQVVAHPDLIDPEDDEALAETLGVLLDRGARERARYRRTLAEARAGDRKFASLERRISLKQSEKILDAVEDGILDGIGLEAHNVRFYPRNGGEPDSSLASHVLGFVDAEGIGGEGVERYYDERLTTVDPGAIDLATIDGSAISLVGIDPPALELTIDAGLQKQLEKELHTARVANDAKSASAIVMDPRTGAVLAAASVPAYDAEDYQQIANEDISRLRNRVFSDQYEPGSVMKIFTATAALDLGLVTPNTRIKDQAQLKFWDDTVRNADHGSEGVLAVRDVIAMSRNVATAKIARKLAPHDTQKAARRLHALWDKVGLVGRTGADISSEAPGSSYDPANDKWAAVDLANRAFGQGASFTLPQLARGMSTLVNGGFLVQPHLVADGVQAKVEPKRVLREKTARQAKDILRHVTGSRSHYAAGSLIPGYDIGGKTGTAQIWDVRHRRWKPRRFNHSFVGFVAGRKQEYVIAVRLEEPVPIGARRGLDQGIIPLHIESYQLFQMVAHATIDKLHIKRSKKPGAGLPIIGTQAAQALTPERNREARQAARQERDREARQADSASRATRTRSDRGDAGAAALDPAPASRSVGGEGT